MQHLGVVFSLRAGLLQKRKAYANAVIAPPKSQPLECLYGLVICHRAVIAAQPLHSDLLLQANQRNDRPTTACSGCQVSRKIKYEKRATSGEGCEITLFGKRFCTCTLKSTELRLEPVFEAVLAGPNCSLS